MTAVHLCSILTHAGRPPVTAQDERLERATVLLLTVGVVVGVAMVTAIVRGIIAGKDISVFNSYFMLAMKGAGPSVLVILYTTCVRVEPLKPHTANYCIASPPSLYIPTHPFIL